MSDRFELPSELNIYSALDSRDALMAWVSEQMSRDKGSLEVSALHVEEVDGAGLQLLASLSNMDVRWQLVASSDAFAQACRTMGFGHWLDKHCLNAGMLESNA